MTSSLSNLFDKLVEKVHKIKFKHRHDKKNANGMELNTMFLSAVVNTQTLKMI